MTYLIASEARKSLYKLIDEVTASHEPTLIKGKRNVAVLISLDDWEDIQETIFVASNKELSDSIIKGLNTPFEKCSTTLE
ncbi:type II toxin-antitoxin system Phd/YefM family antitoxin [Rickettsia endosymbiont of Polydrusus tereticollis]|uniref:type II toxin-antitoxin system Phd/YefM family antitoxin n=1 Tax=Rickettsia endosymbiont of Polydrusus tereticollis TaxID=3066251 RepID=UPI00313298D4